MYSPGEKIIRFMKGPNFKNMILNIVIRIILYCMFFTSEFITTPAEPFVANYNEWQTAYAKPIKRDQFCSDFFLIIVCSIVPIATFGLFSLCISGSNKGFNIVINQYRFIMSLSFVFALTGLFTDIIKNSIGRLRPDYLSRCFNLDEYQLLDALENITRTWPGFNPNCTNLDLSEIRTGRRSFPSGHASISTATWLFLCLSLKHMSSTNLQVRSRLDIPLNLNFNALILPIGMLVPLVISISRFTDNRHHPGDIIAGALLGAFIAISVHHSDIVGARQMKKTRHPEDSESDASLPLDPESDNDGYTRNFESESEQ